MPPPPPPPPTVQNPQLLWTGDVQVSSVLGDHGINDAIYYNPGVVLVADGSGGEFAVWESDVQGEVFVQRIDANGHTVWPSEISVAPDSPFTVMPAAVADGAGGVIVAWVDGRAGFCNLGFKGSCHIYAQRFNASGDILWQIDGVPVVTFSGNQGITGIGIVADGSGGAVLGWGDNRVCCTIFAQRINTSGASMWPINGIQVNPDPTLVTGTIGAGTQMIGDGAGKHDYFLVERPGCAEFSTSDRQCPVIRPDREAEMGKLWCNSGHATARSEPECRKALLQDGDRRGWRSSFRC